MNTYRSHDDRCGKLVGVSEHPDPHTTVEVGFTNSDYMNVCERYGGGREVLEQWRALGDFLAHRPGWHFDVVNEGEALWSLGSFGESLLNIHVQADGTFHCLDFVQDKQGTGHGDSVLVTTSLGHIERWLEDREAEARRPSPVARRWMSDDNWRLLRSYEFVAQVSWSDGWYLATVPKMPEEATFEKTLHAVISSTKVMIVRSLEAPEDLTEGLRLRVNLHEHAVRQFAKGGG